MAASKTDIDELLTCSICCIDYDTIERIPKFLNCHHTFCIICLKAMFYRLYLMCPMCRIATFCPKGPVNLRTNMYVLHFIQSGMKLTQASDGVTECESGDLSQKENSNKNFSNPLSGDNVADQEWQRGLKYCKENFTNAFKKWQEVQSNLQHALLNLKAVQAEMTGKMEENKLHMAHLLLTAKSLDSFHNQEDAKCVLEKLPSLVLESKDELKIVTKVLTDTEAERAIFLRITLETENQQKIPTFSQLEDGFTMKNSQGEIKDSKELFLLWFLAMKVCKQKNISLEPEVQTSNSAATSALSPVSTPVERNNGLLTRPSFDRSSGPDLNLTFSKRNIVLGHVKIRPLWNAHAFMNELAEFIKSPKIFDSIILTANSKSYVKIGFSNETFQPKLKPYSSDFDSSQALDVGICRSIQKEDRTVTWEMMFLLRPYLRENMEPSFLFGRITHGQDFVHELSHMTGRLRNGMSVEWSVTSG